jgi:opacity protein-like surface antigen
MTRKFLGILGVAIALCGAAPLRAQLMARSEGFRFGLGLGPTLPMGELGDADKMGINILGVFETPLAGSPLYLRADGLYSSTSHDGLSGSTSILGGTASALYHFSAPAAQARPYVLGGLGIYNVDLGAALGGSQTKIGFALGGGVTFNVGGFNAFAEARYISIQTSNSSATLVPLTVGMMFGY